MFDRWVSKRKLVILETLVFQAVTFFLILLMVSVHFCDLPWSLPHLRRFGNGGQVLDLTLGYSPSSAYAWMNSLGGVGRDCYLNNVLFGIDLILPVVMATFLSLGIHLLLKRIANYPQGWHKLVWLPVLAMLFDYVENCLLGILVRTFPARNDYLCSLASAFTTAKLVSYGLSGVIILALLVRLVLGTKKKSSILTDDPR
ncbi:MAG TPA: hypothetical protein V6C76_17205 [Drouetiella sp.]